MTVLSSLSNSAHFRKLSLGFKDGPQTLLDFGVGSDVACFLAEISARFEYFRMKSEFRVEKSELSEKQISD